MKVALCLHGYFDSLHDSTSKGADGYHHIKKHILDVADTDVFIHNWQPTLSGTINELYKPVLTKYEEQIDFEAMAHSRHLDRLPNPPRKPSTIYSHFYSIQEAFKLCYASGNKYDVVIKARFDLGRINRNTSGPGKRHTYAVQCINFNPNIDMSRFYMAHWEMFDQGPPDMWFYSSDVNMAKFCSIYDDISRYMVFGSEFSQFVAPQFGIQNISNAVLLYKWWLQKNGLWDIRESLETQYE
jgi:hypothetical protein